MSLRQEFLWMATGYKVCFMGEVTIHFDVKYHVAVYLLVPNEQTINALSVHNLRTPTIPFLEGDVYVFHLFLNCTPPMIHPRFSIYLEGVLDGLWYFNAKFM